MPRLDRITMEKTGGGPLVLKDRIRLRRGDQLEFSEEARPDESCEVVVVQNGQDPIVANPRTVVIVTGRLCIGEPS
jgi:hypothetical protein